MAGMQLLAVRRGLISRLRAERFVVPLRAERSIDGQGDGMVASGSSQDTAPIGAPAGASWLTTATERPPVSVRCAEQLTVDYEVRLLEELSDELMESAGYDDDAFYALARLYLDVRDVGASLR